MEDYDLKLDAAINRGRGRAQDGQRMAEENRQQEAAFTRSREERYNEAKGFATLLIDRRIAPLIKNLQLKSFPDGRRNTSATGERGEMFSRLEFGGEERISFDVGYTDKGLRCVMVAVTEGGDGYHGAKDIALEDFSEEDVESWAKEQLVGACETFAAESRSLQNRPPLTTYNKRPI